MQTICLNGHMVKEENVQYKDQVNNKGQCFSCLFKEENPNLY